MDEESLIRLCVGAYSITEITSAKNLLFESISTSTRNVSRRKNKEQKEIEDIISVFKSTDPDKTPIFVARVLDKLPPITFDHIDVTALLKDIIVLKSEVKYLKESSATNEQLDIIKQDLEHMKQSSSPTMRNTNRDLSGNQSGNNSSDFSPHQLSTNKLCVESASSGMTLNTGVQRLSEAPPANAGACAEEQNITTAHASPDVCTTSGIIITEQNKCFSQNFNVKQDMITSNASKNMNKMSMADIVRQGGAWKVNEPDQEWQEFQRRKLRNRQIGVKGKAAVGPDDKFKPAEIKTSLFLSNVHKDTSENDIIQYILSKTKQNISLQKIKMKTEKPYNAYKIIVNRNALDIFLNNENIWPEGVTCRRFRPYRTTVPNGE
ncbi:hypothetical protein HF086_008869 [Spodoptera exigua]|uniref:Mutant cadherin n=1 Tax=Spodoptera exigua TaxID=7107 RepID=A0A922SBT6_SPOEX|nr:hypothetical protein HF086_008869 [Spodoptera exigua]